MAASPQHERAGKYGRLTTSEACKSSLLARLPVTAVPASPALWAAKLIVSAAAEGAPCGAEKQGFLRPAHPAMQQLGCRTAVKLQASRLHSSHPCSSQAVRDAMALLCNTNRLNNFRQVPTHRHPGRLPAFGGETPPAPSHPTPAKWIWVP